MSALYTPGIQKTLDIEFEFVKTAVYESECLDINYINNMKDIKVISIICASMFIFACQMMQKCTNTQFIQHHQKLQRNKKEHRPYVVEHKLFILSSNPIMILRQETNFDFGNISSKLLVNIVVSFMCNQSNAFSILCIYIICKLLPYL